MKSKIKEWLPFSDKETSLFQNYFINYLIDNEDKLSKMDCYKLAVLARETQYQMRILKARINGENNLDIKSNDFWINEIVGFDNLIEYIVESIETAYDKLPPEQKYELFKQNYSYFTASEETIKSIKDDIHTIY